MYHSIERQKFFRMILNPFLKASEWDTINQGKFAYENLKISAKINKIFPKPIKNLPNPQNPHSPSHTARLGRVPIAAPELDSSRANRRPPTVAGLARRQRMSFFFSPVWIRLGMLNPGSSFDAALRMCHSGATNSRQRWRQPTGGVLHAGLGLSPLLDAVMRVRLFCSDVAECWLAVTVFWLEMVRNGLLWAEPGRFLNFWEFFWNF